MKKYKHHRPIRVFVSATMLRKMDVYTPSKIILFTALSISSMCITALWVFGLAPILPNIGSLLAAKFSCSLPSPNQLFPIVSQVDPSTTLMPLWLVHCLLFRRSPILVVDLGVVLGSMNNLVQEARELFCGNPLAAMYQDNV